MNSHSLQLLHLAGALLTFAIPSMAATISLQGQLDDENAVKMFSLTVYEPGGATISVRSFGYGGGLNNLLDPIASGGFAPSLALYTTDPSAFPQLLAQDALGGTVLPGPTDSCSNGSNIDTVTGFCLDALLSYTTNGPGTFILTVSVQGNDGGPFLDDPFPGSLPPGFLDAFGNERTSSYALDISGADLDGAGVPEPSAAVLMAVGLAAVAAGRAGFRRSK